MPVDLKEMTTSAQDNVLNVVKISQGYVLEAVKTFVDTVEKFTPDMPMPAMPLLDKLPVPTEAMSMWFGFAEKLFEAQKAFALSLVETLTPKMPAKS
jgi:hypothetical protein